MTATQRAAGPARRRHRAGERGLPGAPAAQPRARRPGPRTSPAAPRRTGRSPSRRRSGSATAPAPRSTTSTATSTSTCTAATACRWPATPIPRSSRRCRTGSRAAPTSPSRPRTRSGSPTTWPRRFDLPLWRFANSGTEATMDAVHLVRAATGRDLIIKVEGCYHGHHDSVEVSVLPEADDDRARATGRRGSRTTPASPRAIMDLVTVVPFNDLEAVERALAEHRGEVAGMILEPVMMNAGIIPPDDGYLAGHPRPAAPPRRAADLRRGEDRPHHRAGRGDRALGVVPDMVCLAKALGGGISTAAIGGSEDVMSADRRRPLRAGRHLQRQPARDGRRPGHADRGAHPGGVRAPRRARRPDARGLQEVIDRHGVRLAGRHRGRQGVRVVPAPTRSATSATSWSSTAATATPHWLMQHNRGVFLPPWGKVEQWLLSVQHTDEDVDRFVANFEHLVSRLTAAEA